MNDCLFTSMDEFVYPGETTAHDSVRVFDEFYFLTLKRDMMIRNVRSGTLVIFFIYYGIP